MTINMSDYYVSPKAQIGRNVRIGHGAVIEDDVVIGDDCYIDDHVKIGRYTTIGERSRIYLGAFIGAEPQDHRFKEGIYSRTEIGHDTTLREYVTIHRSPFEGGLTKVGDHTLLMAFAHVGHDGIIGNNVTVANHTSFSGHVLVEDGAVLSGYILVHQFCRIGSLSMTGARTIITQDIPPFVLLSENNCVCASNTVGLRRAGFSSELRMEIRRAIKTYYFKQLNAKNALQLIKSAPMSGEVKHFVEFVENSERGVMPGDPKIIDMVRHEVEAAAEEAIEQKKTENEI